MSPLIFSPLVDEVIEAAVGDIIGEVNSCLVLGQHQCRSGSIEGPLTHQSSSFSCYTARTCFVRPHSTDTSRVPPNVDYPLNSQYTLVIDGYIRCVHDVMDSQLLWAPERS